MGFGLSFICYQSVPGVGLFFGLGERERERLKQTQRGVNAVGNTSAVKSINAQKPLQPVSISILQGWAGPQPSTPNQSHISPNKTPNLTKHNLV